MKLRTEPIKLIISVLACQCAGIIGALFTAPAIAGWYSALRKPFFTPPSWVFAPAWTTLYLLMGVSFFLVWRLVPEKKNTRPALYAFLAQLALNALWSPVFFGMRSPLGGLIVIFLLWLAILVTILMFLKVSKAASYLLFPYILWVSFALALNAAIFHLNP